MCRMGKRIMILNGSPRRKGNTAALAAAFAEGAEAAGASVTVFDLGSMNIHPCLGCLAGASCSGSPCVQKDDMEAVYAAFRQADGIVLASPLYYWTISGQLKCALDRLFAVAELDMECHSRARDCALLMAAEGDGFEETVFWYDRLMGYLGWQDRGKVLCGGVLNVGDIQGRPELDQARALGAAMA